MVEQKRLDRPELREKLLNILVQNCSLVDGCPKQCTPTDGEVCYGHLVEPLVALIEPLIEEAKKHIGIRILEIIDNPYTVDTLRELRLYGQALKEEK